MSSANGTATQRKTLSSQIDRLDCILDGLADGLNEAVTQAVKDAVEQAVRVSVRETLQTVFKEIANNPQFHDMIRALIVPAQISPAPAQAQVVKEAAQPKPPARRWGARLCTWAGSLICSKWSQFKLLARSGWGYLKVLWKHRWSVLSLTGVAVSVGIGSFFLGPVISAIFAGLGGASMAVLVVAGIAVWRVCDIAGRFNHLS